MLMPRLMCVGERLDTIRNKYIHQRNKVIPKDVHPLKIHVQSNLSIIHI